MKKYRPHPYADIFPLMEGEPLQALAQRIKEQGLKEKGVLLDGLLLEGRNRQNACEIADVPFEVMPYENLARRERMHGPLNYVFDKNASRRQMTPSQSAIAAAEYASKLAEELKAANASAKADGEKLPAPPPGKLASIAAAKFGVSTRSVEKAQAVKKKSTKKFAQVKAGTTTVNKAAKDVKKADAKKKAFDDSVFRILKVCGNELATAAKKGTRFKGHKEVVAFAALDDKEMKRAQGLIESGWPLKRAMLYKSKEITPKHKVGDLLDKAASEQGKLDIEVNGWKISVRRKAS